MFWRNSIAIILGFGMIASISYAGQETHGGDTVTCRAPRANEANTIAAGDYTLDYLLTYQASTHENAENDIEVVESWEESANRLMQVFRSVGDYFGDAFEDFVTSLENHSDYSQNRIWEQAAFGLTDIKDESFLRLLPSNCMTQDRDGSMKARIRQAVLRTENSSGLVIYQYDRPFLGQFKSAAALQYSFLMVHEFLRDFVQDAEVIKRVNRFVHSKLVSGKNVQGEWSAKMNQAQIVNIFYRMGLIQERGIQECRVMNANSNYNFNVPDEVVRVLVRQ